MTPAFLFPGEDEIAALARRVKMHEFLIPGGVKTGIVDGNAVYSDPIVVDDWEACPWHGSAECTAWIEIRAGRNPEAVLARLVEELRTLENEYLVLLGDDIEPGPGVLEELAAMTEEIASLRDRVRAQEVKINLGLSLPRVRDLDRSDNGSDHEPFWGMNTERGTVDEATILCNSHQAISSVRATAISAAGPDVIFGNWVRVPRAGRQCIACVSGNHPLPSSRAQQSHQHQYDRPQRGYEPRYRPVPVPEPDARNDAVAAFAGAVVADDDEIVIEGDEHE